MKPSFNHSFINIKQKPMDRTNPGPSKTDRRSRAKSSDKGDYGSTKNKTDESESTVGAVRGAGEAKPNLRATTTTEGHNTRSKTATSVHAGSYEGVSESENDVDNVGCRKRGGAGVAPKESGRKSSACRGGSIAGRLRNSECSKEVPPTRKGRAQEGGVTGGKTAVSGNPLPPKPRRAKLAPTNPFKKPSVASLKKSGESFLQVK